MRNSQAASAFYLAIFSFFSAPTQAASSLSSATCTTSRTDPNVCALEPKAQVSDACASYADLEALNTRLQPAVRDLAFNTDFFAYYRLNLYNKVCPFWSDENGLCGNIACAVSTLENEEDIPAIWRAQELSKLEGPKAQHPGRVQQRERQRPLLGELGENVGESCVVEIDDECDERDYCVPEDESATAKGDYVSLVDNPERFTGYSGEAAHQVWEAIYRENCFSRPVTRERAGDGNFPGLAGMPPSSGLSPKQAQAAMDFKHVWKAHDRAQALSEGRRVEEVGTQFEDECVEKRIFYRIISGMHASISMHLCHDYLNQTTGQWGPNLQCYRDRLHNHPDRIANLYFNYALVLRAVGKLRDHIHSYTFCTGDVLEDARTKGMLQSLAGAIPAGPEIFDERVMFRDQSASGISLKEDFRMRFRNVSRIMDCVGCDKCRLWGKIQTNGLGTALKVLFEFTNGDDEVPLLRRTELVALVNTLDKIAVALKALVEFREMMDLETRSESVHVEEDAPVSSPATNAYSPPVSSYPAVDDFDADLTHNGTPPPLGQVIRSELAVVLDVVLLILRSWLQLPKVLGTLALAETQRVIDAWLGRPPSERVWTWQIKWPDREEMRERLRGGHGGEL